MAMIKCPRCELNYIQDADKMCTVCRREMHGEDERLEITGICPECGERSVAPGEELCVLCLKEASRQEGMEDEEYVEESPSVLTPPSAMDEIEEIEIDGAAGEEFAEIKEEFDEDEKPEEEEELPPDEMPEEDDDLPAGDFDEPDEADDEED